MSQAKILDKASTVSFISGFMLSKLQYLPFPLVAAIFRIISLGLYFAGYGSWLAASYLQPDHKEEADKWYNFIASAIGFMGTVLNVAAVFIPVLFPPAAGFYLLGNIIWAAGQYHKLKTPPTHKPDYSATQQKAYLSYTITTTCISLVSFAAATLIVAFPLATAAITIASLLVCAGLGALAFEYLLDSSFGDHKPLKNSHSNLQMNRLKDSIKKQPQKELNCDLQHSTLFVTATSKEKTNSNQLLDNLSTTNLSPESCSLSAGLSTMF